MSRVMRDSYITIQGFMISELGLSGASLIIYAVIYGFSQDGESCFQGSRQYLANWCGCSISGVKKCLRQLQEAGLIEQIHHSKDNHEVYYRAKCPRAQSDLGQKVTEARAQSDLDPVQKVTEARAQSDQHYNDDNIEDKLEDKLEDNIVVDQSTRAPFKIPTFEAVKTFAERKGPAVVDPVTFYEYYQSNGWKVGKNKMKDWRAAFRRWENTEKGNGGSSFRTGSKTTPAADIPIMENEYTPEHLEKREAESLALLDNLLEE